VTQVFDEPLERVDAAAFAARQLAERLHDRLAGHGLACTRLGIAAFTDQGRELYRTWRHDGLLTAAAIADRVRWQLDGWLARSRAACRSGYQPALVSRAACRSGYQPALVSGPGPGAIVRLRLYPDGVLDYAGLQLGLWGDAGEERDRAHRALTRVQGMLGPDAVLTAVLGGGRDPADRIRLVPWGDERPAPAAGPWPGGLPAPSPATVLPEPLPVDIYDAEGGPVRVTARLELTARPARLEDDEIVGWAGPWPVDERWWAPGEASRRVRFQVCLADGRALLLSLEGGAWSIQGVYD
jgi:protein ImuB